MKRHIPLPTVAIACFLQTTLPADDWPQWRGPARDGVWRESGIIEKFDGPRIKRRWTVPISGGYSGPTVADGRVYVSDRVTEPREMERVHCFDWQTGRKLWTYAYECRYRISYRAGPRASISVDDGRAFCLGAMGHLLCLDAGSGKLLWKKEPGRDYQLRVPIWGSAAAPLVEGDLLITQLGAAEGACIVALDKRTGQQRWAALDDPASYSAPIVVDQAGRRVLVCRTGTRLVGLDACSGRLYWAFELGYGQWVIAVATPVLYRDRIFCTAMDKGSIVIRLLPDKPQAEKVWWRYGPSEKQTDSLQSLICTPYLADGYAYGVSLYGILRCIDVKTGDRIWADDTATSQTRWGTLHIVRNADKVWIFNQRGELIIARLTAQGFQPISRAKLIDPTRGQLNRRDGVTWSHPAFAYKHVFIRNDKELVCANLAAEKQ